VSSLSYYQSLEFDLPRALLEQLVELFDQMSAEVLSAENVAGVEEVQGVYQLFLDGQIKYIGKTDSESGLHNRLTRHAKKIEGRPNLDTARVTFKAVHIYVFTAMDLEALLIRHYGLTSANSWNSSGFGSNDPGRQRDTTRLKPTHFDKLYPISLANQVNLDVSEEGCTVHEVLAELKRKVPFVIRFETLEPTSRQPHEDLVSTTMQLDRLSDSVESILLQVGRALGPSWQVTAFPGYVIVYKTNPVYLEGRIISPVPGTPSGG
jgi:hypothetical protein